MSFDMQTFLDGMATTAHEQGMESTAFAHLKDGFTEVIFTDKHNPIMQMAIEFRVANGSYKGRLMLEVRRYDKGVPSTFFVSPIPYVLFGAKFCEL